MKRSVQRLAALLLGALLLDPLSAVQASPRGSPQLLAAGATNPYNSPIRRANPNSRQGSVLSTPPVRGPSTMPNPRPPTLDNRGIGNGENLRREQQPPLTDTPRPERPLERAP